MKKIFKSLALLGLMTASMSCSFVQENKIIHVKESENVACFETNEAQLPKLLSVQEENNEEITENSTLEWLKNFFDTYLVPIIGSSSIVSVVSAIIVSVLSAIRKKELKKMLEKNNQINLQAQDNLKNSNNTLAKINEVKLLEEENIKINTEINRVVNEKVEAIEKVVEDNNKKIERLDNVYEALKLLSQIQIKVAKSSKDVIKSGLVEDIQNLSNIIKKI